MDIEALHFSQAFKRLYLHRYADPAWKVLESLCGEERTALRIRLNETEKVISSITAYSWLKNRLCLVYCTVYPCLGEDGHVDIWNMSDVDLIDDGRDDNRELERILNRKDLQKQYNGYSLDFYDEPSDFYKERWYIAEDYGNYDGWIQCCFAQKFIKAHPQYTVPKHELSDC